MLYSHSEYVLILSIVTAARAGGNSHSRRHTPPSSQRAPCCSYQSIIIWRHPRLLTLFCRDPSRNDRVTASPGRFSASHNLVHPPPTGGESLFPIYYSSPRTIPTRQGEREYDDGVRWCGARGGLVLSLRSQLISMCM